MLHEYGIRLTFGDPYTSVLPGGMLEERFGNPIIADQVQPPVEIYSSTDLTSFELHHASLAGPIKSDTVFADFHPEIRETIRARIPESDTPYKVVQVRVKVVLFQYPSGRKGIDPQDVAEIYTN